jgi:hypothetical protein
MKNQQQTDEEIIPENSTVYETKSISIYINKNVSDYE